MERSEIMVSKTSDRNVATIDRRSKSRRTKTDENIESSQSQNGDERRKVERRRHIDPTTCERDYSEDEIAFMKAMDEYKRKSGRQFPTWSEVLEVVRCLGYRPVAEPTEINGR